MVGRFEGRRRPALALHAIAHDHQQSLPIGLRVLLHRQHNPLVDPAAVRLAQPHNKDAVVLLLPMRRESLVC
jgi:hypothetical protein